MKIFSTLLSYVAMMLLGLTLASLVPRESGDGDLSDYSKFLEAKQAEDFMTWLMSGKRSWVDRADLEKRHADGSFTNDMNAMLDRMSAKNFLEWLKAQGRSS